jgi:hypothetical protein
MRIYLLFFFSFQFYLISGQYAPKTFIGNANPCEPSFALLPVVDTNFINISSVSLRLDFNPMILAYDTFSNLNPALSGMIINNNHVNDTLDNIIFTWSSTSSRSIPDGESLVELKFFFSGGMTNLSWNNTSNNGGDCEYSDSLGNALIDIPTSSYYYNGYIQGGTIGPPGQIFGEPIVCRGDSDVIYAIDPVVNATSYVWSVPLGAIIVSGDGTPSIHVYFPEIASSGNILVHGISGSCAGPQSDPLWVDIKEAPQKPSVSLFGNCIVSDASEGNQWYNDYGLIQGAVNPEFCPNESGNYYDIVTIEGCSSPQSNVITFIPMGFQEPSVSFETYPNPFVQSFSVECRGECPKNLTIVQLADVFGNIVYSFTWDPKQVKLLMIPGNHLQSGIYFLRITNATFSSVLKMVKS